MSFKIKAQIRKTVAALSHSLALPQKVLRGRVCVLTYHRVLRPEQVRTEQPQPGMYVTAAAFDQHLTYLRDNFHVLSISELFQAWSTGGLDRHEPHCVITFDDGWRDNYEVAYPLLCRHGLPATIFLPTAFVGTCDRFWPDILLDILRSLNRSDQALGRSALRAAARLPPTDGVFAGEEDEVIEHFKTLAAPTREHILRAWTHVISTSTAEHVVDWPAVEMMSRDGITFGSHTHRHAILPQLSDSEVVDELSSSLALLLRPGVNAVRVLAYPNGNYDSRISELARRCGFEGAVSCTFGPEGRVPRDLFAIRRINVHQDIASSTALFAHHIAGGNRVPAWT